MCAFCVVAVVFVLGHTKRCAYKPTIQRQITEMTKHKCTHTHSHMRSPPTAQRPLCPPSFPHAQKYATFFICFCFTKLLRRQDHKIFSAAAVTFFLLYCCCCWPAFGLWPGFYAALYVCVCVWQCV